MSIFVQNIEKETLENLNFRKVLATNAYSQLVVMSLKPREEIGMEVHEGTDQFLRIESGVGQAILDGQVYEIFDGFAIVVPAGTNHNIINSSDTEEMKLYTIYSPAHHKDGTIHRTREEAVADEEDHA